MCVGLLVDLEVSVPDVKIIAVFAEENDSLQLCLPLLGSPFVKMCLFSPNQTHHEIQSGKGH